MTSGVIIPTIWHDHACHLARSRCHLARSCLPFGMIPPGLLVSGSSGQWSIMVLYAHCNHMIPFLCVCVSMSQRINASWCDDVSKRQNNGANVCDEVALNRRPWRPIDPLNHASTDHRPSRYCTIDPSTHRPSRYCINGSWINRIDWVLLIRWVMKQPNRWPLLPLLPLVP